MRLWPLAPILLVALGVGCGGQCRVPAPGAAAVRFDAPSELEGSFWAHPWPSNARLGEDGRLRLRAFPNPTGSSTLEQYLEAIGRETRGFGKSSAAYFSFTGPLDPSSLPASPAQSIEPGSSLAWIDIDPNSPERGRRFPIESRFFAAPATYQDPNHLAILPPYGLVLRDHTTYAVIATEALRAADGSPVGAPDDLLNALDPECIDGAPAVLATLLAPLREFLAGAPEERSAIRAATVFTTRDVVGEMRRIAGAARREPVPEVRDLAIAGDRTDLYVLTGAIDMPSFQRGTVPFLDPTEGGEIAWRPDGEPERTHFETTRVSFTLPTGRPMPASGWPVVLYAHGTGGDFMSALNEAIAPTLGAQGIAVVSYDQTLHGPRDPTHTDPSLTFFNLFNIVAGRDNVRQGAVDSVMMTRLIQSIALPAELLGGAAARFDPDRIAFVGHSQGGLTGAPFIAVEPAIKAAVFSGTSGVLSITLQERVDPVDMAALLRSLLSLPESEVLDDMHPILNLLQTFIDPADPISYASSYLSDPPEAAPKDLLFVEGFHDQMSPARGHEALATAARIPVVSPVHRIPAAAPLIDLGTATAPIRENAPTPAGAVTAGLIQYPEGDHWPIFDIEDAQRRYVAFITSALLEGRARIVE